MKEYEIWVEGYAATGERGTASMIGKSFGDSFDTAVIEYMGNHPDSGVEENTREIYMSAEGPGTALFYGPSVQRSE